MRLILCRQVATNLLGWSAGGRLGGEDEKGGVKMEASQEGGKKRFFCPPSMLPIISVRPRELYLPILLFKVVYCIRNKNREYSEV